MNKIGCVQHDCEACQVMVRERVAVYPAEPPRTDWYGQIMRKRDKKKGFDTWGCYAPTPHKAVLAAYQLMLDDATKEPTP